MSTKFKILFADDNAINRMYMVDFLLSFNYEVDCVIDGNQAVIACKNKHYAVLITDINIPNFDGLMATRIIISNNWKINNRNIPVIAVTALRSKRDIEKLFEVGIDYYFEKPPCFEKIHALLMCIYNNFLNSSFI